VGEVMFVQSFELFDELFVECSRVFGRHVHQAGSWAIVVTDELFNEHIIFECERCWNVDVCFAGEQEVSIFSLRPGENDLTAAFQQPHEARVRLDIVKHPVKITGFKAVNFDGDEALVGFYRAEDVAFLADGDGADQPFEIVFTAELEKRTARELVEDAVFGFELVAGFCHLIVNKKRVFKCGGTFCRHSKVTK